MSRAGRISAVIAAVLTVASFVCFLIAIWTVGAESGRWGGTGGLLLGADFAALIGLLVSEA